MEANETRRLLELAAKAAGYALRVEKTPLGLDAFYVDGHRWNPDDDDGDSRRLEVALKMHVAHSIGPDGLWRVEAWFPQVSEGGRHAWGVCTIEPHGDNPCEATRLAVLRAAAAVGEAMP